MKKVILQTYRLRKKVTRIVQTELQFTDTCTGRARLIRTRLIRSST